MAKTTAYSGSLLALLFDATAIANVADNAASSPLTNLYVSLHTADPGLTGNQQTNEVSYTSYARQAVARTSGGWTQTSNQVVNAALISFPKSTGVADNTTAIFWGVGSVLSATGVLYYSGALCTILGAGVAETDDNTITIPGLTGVSVGDKIEAFAIPNSPLPGGVAINTVYFVKTVSGDVVTISTTSGGATLTISADGAAYWSKLSTLQITQNVQPQISASALVITET